ncbi:dihydroxyacetone phosphate acyltransferase isoform X2 [Zootermopsis nevadensis]|nr:dihydroxyacetone phosphate acyltransferase isoform X2 [Zootermopsis nevadensis]XP_021933902.1 dihydroxyacetone phosphate acyltransferase isoform X2 [Zootermopsis nevadensis]XP_021933904.1 dihydroxyacetone phosphate acyltransferase isoform X2 [Zootermopsis nevadensis]XP_021933905.1 dihydroxyacetone phosphate acyltransferase isoform X2 [Zootermopsis nevadensis]
MQQSNMEFESTRSLQAFKDILVDRYGSSDFMWMSQDWQPRVAYLHTVKTNPQKIKQDVLKSPRVLHVIEEASKEQNVPKEELYKTVQRILDEIGYDRQLPVIRWLGLLLLKVLKRTCCSLCVNEGSVNRVLSVMGDNPVIFAPSHRSYGDFVLMSYLCFHYKIEIPAIAAGMDFHSMWLMGRLLRDSCAFFMRRSFGSDKLYWTAFSEYVQKLVVDGEAAIEFFIEGTRSRTAKSLMPKFGFLSMTLMPFLTGRVPDITIVPINISYDRTLEEVLFAYELLGVPKPKESTSGLIKALNMLNERYGKVYMDFAEPISVRELSRFAGFQRSLPTPECPHIQRALSVDEAAFCVEVAHHVVQQQQRHSVISAFNLISIVLNNSVLEGAGPPLLNEVVADVSWLKSVMEVLGALIGVQGVPSGVESAVKEAIVVHKSLVTLTPTNHLKLIKVHTFAHRVDPKKLKGHCLSEQTMDVAIPMVMLQHYLNPCLHYLIGPAMVTLIMLRLDDAVDVPRDQLFQKFSFLRSLFAYEFAFYAAWAEKEFDDAVKQLEVLSVVEPTKPDRLKMGNHRKLQILLSNLLQPFLEAYLSVCHVLQQTAPNPRSESYLLKSTQQRVEELLTSGVVSHPYSLSLDMHSAALQALTSIQAVKRLKRNGVVEYQAQTRKLLEVTQELENVMLQSEEKFHLSDPGSKDFLIHESQQAKL